MKPYQVGVVATFAALGAWAAAASGVRVERVRGISMTPALHNGDWMLVRSASMTVPPREGDVVILALHQSGSRMIKRVLAVPGDTLMATREFICRNGVAIGRTTLWTRGQDGPFQWRLRSALSNRRDSAIVWGPVVLPASRYLTIGDNLAESTDSRAFGPVDASEIQARVWLGATARERMIIDTTTSARVCAMQETSYGT